MVFNTDQFSLDIGDNFKISSDYQEFRDIIIDRKSKYSITAIKVTQLQEVKLKFKEFKSDSYFRKATHNSYAYRLIQENGSIIEGKNDDGEQGAGLCILREMQRENAEGFILIVTRYFGGVQLHTDRFKNVIDACKIFFEKEKKK